MSKTHFKKKREYFMERNYGIDLLRIIAMMMIVMLHIVGRGGISENSMVFQ